MNRRPLRVAGSIHRILAGSLQTEVPEPEAWKINITQVIVSSDLRSARIFFTSIEGEASRDQAEKILKEHKPVLKRALAKSLRVRFQPELDFVWDQHLLQAEKVEEILDGLKK